MKQLKYLLRKEFLQIARDKTMFKLMLALPIIQLLILPWAATFEQKNIALSVVDNDRSELSTRMIDKVLSSGYFILSDYSDSYDQAMLSIEQNKADLILEIPHNFENSLVREGKTGVLLSVNAVNGQKAGLGASYMGQIIGDFNGNIILEQTPQAQLTNTISVSPYFKYNVGMNYRNFMVPGILVMLMTLIGGVLSAMNIVKEKEIGTIEQINVTPIPKYVFILGKIIPFLIIGFVILTLGMLVAWILYGLVPLSSILLLYLFAFFYLLAFLGAGLIISSHSETQQQAMFVAFFFLIIFFLLSGLFTPISSMPQWAQIVTSFNPVRYFVEVMRMIYMKGSTFTEMLPQFYAIVCFAIFFITCAVWSYRKTN